MITKHDGVHCGHFLIPYIEWLEKKVKGADNQTDKEYYQYELTEHRGHLKRFLRRRTERRGFQSY